jgi:hypothetical protein
MGENMKYKIKQATISYENLKVQIGDEWYYMSADKLKGVIVNGTIVKKRTRTWLE